MAVEVHRRLFTVEEYNRMLEGGIVSEDDRLELIEGEILTMAAKGSRHSACVKRLTDLFYSHARQTAIISVQDPITLGPLSEPEPDLALLRLRDDMYATSHPGAADTLLVVEESDTSVSYDREVKMPLYARASIPELWIVNLPGDIIEVYSQPSDGRYMAFVEAGRGSIVTAQSVADLSVEVDAILG